MKAAFILALSGPVLAQIPNPPNFLTVPGLLATATVVGCSPPQETAPIQKVVKCGASDPPAALVDFISTIPNNTSSAKTKEILPAVLIPTYFNIISTKASQGRYSDAFYINQLAVLNDRYATTNFQFDLAGFKHVVDDKFAIGKLEATQEEMKRKYHQGGYSALNLYYLSDWAPTEFNNKTLPDGSYMFGSCSFPRRELDSDTIALDGCILQQDTLPGNTVKPTANLGLTTVHEVGHWLGLLHPWFWADSTPGECIQDNGIPDLPRMYEPKEGCANNFKSCSLQPAPFVDPIHNYMGYSDDCCLYEFTPGQIVAMFATYDDMRLNK